MSGWTVDTLRESLTQQISDQREASRQQVDDLRRMLDERYATQTKALDKAFTAAEQAVTVALANAEKATIKAEAASERRFASVNEFRAALADQAATFLPRGEYEAGNAAVADRIAAGYERLTALELRLTSRLDKGDGTVSGAASYRSERRLDGGQMIQVLIVLVAVAAVVVAILKK